MFPAPREATDVAGSDRGGADGAGAGELLDSDRGARASRPHRLQHFLSRAVWDHEAVRSHLADDQAVLVVDETGDEKLSTDAVGAARQYSGTPGGIGLGRGHRSRVITDYS
ncbi:transposase [Streptomyces mirabilis]|uniref:transposase n=1 Tax=Streptomyces mirabilis TaxID=68239 RepID=UPI0036A5543E